MICESKDLATMDTHIVFGKLQEYETELMRLADNEEDNKNNRKIIVLKATNIKDMESEDEDCQSEINKFVRSVFQKFKQFLLHEKQTSRLLKQREERSPISTCHQYGEKRHIRPNYH